MIRFFKALVSDTVSLILLILCILAVIGYYTKDLNMTPFLAIMALNIIFNVNEKSRFIENVIEIGSQPQYQGFLTLLNLNIGIFRRRKKNWFEILVISLIIIGTAVMMVIVGKEFIF